MTVIVTWEEAPESLLAFLKSSYPEGYELLVMHNEDFSIPHYVLHRNEKHKEVLLVSKGAPALDLIRWGLFLGEDLSYQIPVMFPSLLEEEDGEWSIR